ncbi:hypothetical protein [Arcanobacterium canis]
MKHAKRSWRLSIFLAAVVSVSADGGMLGSSWSSVGGRTIFLG